MNDAVFVALIGVVVATVPSLATILTASISWRQKRSDRREDYERQDKVAAQAAEAARLLVASNEHIAFQNIDTQHRLQEIHTLVNSNLTKAMQDRLVATMGQVALTKEIIRINRSGGIEPDKDELVSLQNLEEVVRGLKESMQERTEATQKAEAQRGG